MDITLARTDHAIYPEKVQKFAASQWSSDSNIRSRGSPDG
jgi:hypothetical protein